MKKAEEFANLRKSNQTTLWNRIYYFFLIRRIRKAAKQHYEGFKFYNTIFNPYIRERLEKDGFKVKDKEDKKGKEYINVRWVYKKKNNSSDDSETDGDENTID